MRRNSMCCYHITSWAWNKNCSQDLIWWLFISLKTFITPHDTVFVKDNLFFFLFLFSYVIFTSLFIPVESFLWSWLCLILFFWLDAIFLLLFFYKAIFFTFFIFIISLCFFFNKLPRHHHSHWFPFNKNRTLKTYRKTNKTVSNVKKCVFLSILS